MNRLRDRFNRCLDHMVRPEIRLFRHSCPAFNVFIYLGTVLAVGATFSLVSYQGLSVRVMGGIVAAVAVAILLALAVVAVFPNYHMQATVIAAAAGFLWLTRQPVLPYLDLVACALGLAVASGRIGCLLVGCCHGRPHRWGVRYRPEHAEAGFEPSFVGARLFPIQLVESGWVFAAVAVGVALVLRDAPPGAALASYVVLYGVGRFGFEFARGDTRPYRASFSAAQWTSLVLLLVVVAAELSGAIPLQWWHLAAAGGMVLTMFAVSLHRRLRRDARHRLLSARHIGEVAEALQLLSTRGETAAPAHGNPQWLVTLASTSAGFHISAGRAEDAQSEVRHYTLSATGQPLGHADARTLARLLLLLRHPDEHGEVVPGREGVFHLIVRQAQTARGPLQRLRTSHDQPHPALAR